MNRLQHLRLFGAALLCLLLLACRVPADPNGSLPPVRVALAPFTIIPVVLEGASVRGDQAEMLRHLADEATKQARRSLKERHIADAVDEVPAQGTVVKEALVKGEIHMPVSMPKNVIGWDASHRSGTFATATIFLFDVAGKQVSQQEVTLKWNDVWWFVGGKAARNFPLDVVLGDFARKAADHAVRSLDRRALRPAS